ncbi:MAG: hypothetical protein JJT82_01095 [Legionellaceae bacterium]|nr:hypothetical protein [Legionellaceae bacterium]
MPKIAIQTVLSPAQEAFIVTSIEHLLDFSSSPVELTETLRELALALHADAQPPIDEGIRQLIAILQQPTQFLFRLEQLNADRVSLACVQEFILFVIGERLEAAAAKAGITLEWSVKTLGQRLIAPDAKTIPFASDTPSYSSPHPQAFVCDPEKIYEADLSIDEWNHEASIHIRVVLPDGKTYHEDLHLHDFRASTEVVQRAAEIRAELVALQQAVFYLIEQKVPAMGPDLFETAQHVPFMQAFLVDKTYLSLLAQQKIALSELQVINTCEYQNLTHPSIKSLIAHDILSLSEAKTLTVPQKRVITQPLYFALFKNRTLRLYDLAGIEDEASEVLVHPVTLQLIQRELLSFAQAKSLPQSLTLLFAKNIYRHFFLNGTVNWDFLPYRSTADYRRLQDDKITALLHQQVMSIDEVLRLPSRQIVHMLSDAIHTLMLGKQVSLSQLKALPESFIARMQSDSSYVRLIQSGQLSLEQLPSFESYQFFPQKKHAEREGYSSDGARLSKL